MPCSPYQKPSVRLATRPDSVPTHWVCRKAGRWSLMPLPNDLLSPGDPDALTCVCPHCHSLGFKSLSSHWEQRPQSTDDQVRKPICIHQESAYKHDQASQHGKDHNQSQQDPWNALTQMPSPSPDCGFESHQSSMSTSSLVSLHSTRSRGHWHTYCGWHCRESGGHKKINLPVFKDEDKKDAITYQSWHWDIMVYHWAGCQDHTLLPYIIHSLQGYIGELVRSLGTDITLDCMLTVLDEHYINVKALDTLNQELFQLWMSEKEMVSDWGGCLSRHLQVLMASFPDQFPPDCITELKHDCFYGRLPKQVKAMVAYCKASMNEKDILRLPSCSMGSSEREKVMETSWNMATASTNKLKVTSSFLLWKLKGSQLAIAPSTWVACLEEKSTNEEEVTDGDNPDGIKGVTEEFIVHLARAVKEA